MCAPRIVLLSAILAMAAGAAAQTPVGGEIAGRIVDVGGAAIPGVSISVRSDRDSRTAMTDVDGRFSVDGLPFARYRIVVSLTGFHPQSTDISLTPANTRATLSWPLEVGCLETVRVIAELDPRRIAASAEIIALIEVVSSDGPLVFQSRSPCATRDYETHTFRVMRTVTTAGGAGIPPDTFRKVMDEHLDRGTQYLVAMRSGIPARDAFFFRIVGGAVADPYGGELNGLRVNEAFDTLVRWANDRPRR